MSERIEVATWDGRPIAKGKVGDVCYDLRSAGHIVIANGATAVVLTGLKLRLPHDVGARVLPRSGLSKRGLLVQVGTIDPGYRGEIGVTIHNATGTDFEVEAGDRIAQLEFFRLLETTVAVLNWDDIDEEETDRGANGFGSTGIK